MCSSVDLTHILSQYKPIDHCHIRMVYTFNMLNKAINYLIQNALDMHHRSNAFKTHYTKQYSTPHAPVIVKLDPKHMQLPTATAQILHYTIIIVVYPAILLVQKFSICHAERCAHRERRLNFPFYVHLSV